MEDEMSRELSQSDGFELLGERDRRLILRILRDAATPLSTIALAQRISERECVSPSVRDLRGIYLTLSHDHLPRLEEADAVVYDREEGTVRPGPNFDDLGRVLAEVAARTDLAPGDRCPRCDARVKVRIDAAECEQPVCLRCERALRGTSSAP